MAWENESSTLKALVSVLEARHTVETTANTEDAASSQTALRAAVQTAKAFVDAALTQQTQ